MSSRHGGGQDRVSLSPEDRKAIIVDGDAELLTEKAESIGRSLARNLTTSQIRNVFGTVRQIEMNWGSQATEHQRQQAARQLILLKPKLAYQAARERGRGVKDLADVLTPAIDLVGEDRDRFQNFVDFFEAILAYHTAAGGK
jgi:CRISPR-associated protein Csm2